MRTKKPVIFLAALSLLLASCTPSPEAGPWPTVEEVPGSAGFAGPGRRAADLPAPPSPTGTLPAGEGGAQPGSATWTPALPSFTGGATTTVATSMAPGWIRYDSINQVHDLAFASDGTLWATTGGGLVHWDPAAETYTRYPILARDVAVAPDGTLWLVTGTGVCHFNGTECEPFTSADGLVSDALLAVAVTADGSVWVGGQGGVSRFDGSSWKAYRSPVPTLDLAVAADGDIWAATAGGIGRYLPGQDAWETYSKGDGLPGSQATALSTGPDGKVWTYILWEGLYRFDGDDWTEVDEPHGGTISDITFAADGTPWLASAGGTHYPGGWLAYHDGQAWVEIAQEDGLQSIGAVALGPAGEVAASTSLGLGIYGPGGWRLLKDGPTSDRVTSVAVTPDGAAWFAFGDHSVTTPGGGLSHFDGQGWAYLLEDAEVNALAVAPDGALWAGVGCDVRRLKGNAWETVARCGEELGPGYVLDIDFTPDGAAWVADGFKLGRFDEGVWTFYDQMVHDLVVAPDGSVGANGLWMNGWEGRQGSGFVARFDGQDWWTYRTAESFPGAFQVGAVTADGRLWGQVLGRGLAAFDGRSWEDGDSWDFYESAGDLSLTSGFRLTPGPDGRLWVTTPHGVARFDPQSAPEEAWVLYTPAGGQATRHSGAVAVAPDGAIWLGASQFRPAEVEGELPAGVLSPSPLRHSTSLPCEN